MRIHGTVTTVRGRLGRLALACAVVVAVLLACGASLALGDEEAPTLAIAPAANSTAAPGSMLTYYVEFRNLGKVETNAGFTVTGSFPDGLKPVSVVSYNEFEAGACQAEAHSSTCEFAGTLHADAIAKAEMTVEVEPTATGTLVSNFEISGGGAEAARSVVATEVSNTPPPYGFELDGIASAGPGGAPFTGFGPAPLTQAGAHPYSLTTDIALKTRKSANAAVGDRAPAFSAKDVLVDLPPGFVGNPGAATRCRMVDLANGFGQGPRPLCSPESQVGTISVHINNGAGLPGLVGAGQNILGPLPLYNMVPPPNMPAQFGFNVSGSLVLLDARVRVQRGADGLPVYGLAVDSKDISEALMFNGATVTFWGTPADPSHTSWRACPGGQSNCENNSLPQAFLRNPTSCTAPGEGLTWTAQSDAWANPGRFEAGGAPDLSDPAWASASYVTHEGPGYPYPASQYGPVAGIDDCDRVPFTPSVQVQPTSQGAQQPSGVDASVSVPQEAITDPTAIAQADVRKVVIQFPEGLTLNPASADGLQACSPQQIDLFTTSEPTCPPASKLGDVEVQSPLIPDTLKGGLYLATQGENPFGSLVALYIVIKADGVIIKVPGRVATDPQTGRLTVTFDQLPQLPFSTMQLVMKSGPRAPLSNPSSCGALAMSYTLEGWNGKVVNPSGSYPVECRPGLGSFKPAFVAGASNNAAGAYSPFTLSFSTNEDEQQIKTLEMTLPPGAVAKLTGVPECSDAQANAGTCPADSRIGRVTVGAGTGPSPYILQGSIYLTGPYKGAPFGEAAVVPAIAGPFNLGTVVVRGAIEIDPHTAQPIIVSDPLPQFVHETGMPTAVRRVDAVLDRPEFTFNPTDCKELAITGALTGVQGGAAAESSRFQAANCSRLAFAPVFKASTTSHTSRSNGASLHVALSYPKAPFGSQANIKSVRVELPKALPSRLVTLNHACPNAVFARNPAACPAESRVGYATTTTPVLPVALSGPAYFVSHGNEKFPELIVVLQGDGVTIDLAGETFISKSGVTSSTFKQVPDVPVNTFDLTLPQGKFSALAANGKLCKKSLKMPTTFVAQNGAVLKQSTPIAVSGCPKHKKADTATARRNGRKKGRH